MSDLEEELDGMKDLMSSTSFKAHRAAIRAEVKDMFATIYMIYRLATLPSLTRGSDQVQPTPFYR
jgi:hypothetical protein